MINRKPKVRPHLWLIRLIGVIVPRRLRADWRKEWEAELRYRERLLAEWDRLDWRNKLDLLRRSLSAFWDALLLQPQRWEDEMIQDLRYGVRMMLKHKGFTLVILLTLALGIGANAAVFSLLDAVLLRMLPVQQPEQLVLLRWVSGEKMLWRSLSGATEDIGPGRKAGTAFSFPGFEQLRNHNRSLSDIFAFSRLGVNASIDGKVEEVSSWAVTGGYFAGLGVPAFLGRTLANDDDKANAELAAVIDYDYWQRRFGGDPAVVGRMAILGNMPFTIVGVTPPEFYGTMGVDQRPDFWVPLSSLSQVEPKRVNERSDPRSWWLYIMGRMKPGTSRQQAQVELNLAYQQHAAEVQKLFNDRRDLPQLDISPGSQGVFQARRRFSQSLRLLMTIVGLILAIACLNIANLLLARAASRQKEIAVRLAAGASRFRLIRQLLTESLLLAGLGGALGIVLAHWGKAALISLRPFYLSATMYDLKLDLRLLVFTLAVSALTGFLFGLAPALRATRVELNSALKEGSDHSRYSRSRLSKGMIIAQVAISMVLLIGAGLYIRTVRNLTQVNVGFNRENLLAISINPGEIDYKGERLANLYSQLFERIKATPGVLSVTGTGNCSVFGASCTTGTFCVPGYTPPPGEKMSLAYNSIAPNFFTTMEVPILQGRDVAQQDIDLLIGTLASQQKMAGKTPNEMVAPRQVAVINQAMARKYFPKVNPIGRSFNLSANCKDREFEIIGVAGDVRHYSLQTEARPTFYLPYINYPRGTPSGLSLYVRTTAEPKTMVAAIQRAMQDVEPRLPLNDFGFLKEAISGQVSPSRIIAGLTSFFGILALLLVAIGLYGVMSYTVARRTHEIGVRMALGAQRGDVLRLVMRETLWLAIAGVALGIPAALLATRWIESQLFGLAPHDPLTITLATLLLVAAMALAGYLPARKAVQVDPLIALRCE